MNNSLINIAYNLVSASEKGLEINDLLQKTIEEAHVEKTADVLSNLYMEICTSSKFIYIVDEEGARWDLKTRHSLEEYDKDGYKFVQTADDEKISEFSAVEDHVENEAETEEHEEVEAEDDEEYSEENNDDNYSDSDNYSDDDDDDYFDDLDDDEDKYIETMDQYEDQYDR